jgi:very-short-patch-repair endonuclease
MSYYNNSCASFRNFTFKKKIIEYDGKYWHNDINDEIRNNLYSSVGYDYITINEDIFNRNNLNPSVIETCVNFLRNEI